MLENTTQKKLRICTFFTQCKEVKEESYDDNILESAIPPFPWIERDKEKIKEGKEINMLTPNILLTRLPILLAKIKAGNNSNKLKNQISIYFINIINSQKTFQYFNQVIPIMEHNMVVIREPKNFYFCFYLPKDVDKNFKH